MTNQSTRRPERTAAWKQLTQLAEIATQTHNRVRVGESDRFEKYSIRVGSLLIDFSKQRIDRPIFRVLRPWQRNVEFQISYPRK